MPVYEYQCTDCSKQFELFVPQRMSTDGVVCKQCHSANVRKLVSTFASIGAEGEGSFDAPAMAASGGGCCGGGCGCACGH